MKKLNLFLLWPVIFYFGKTQAQNASQLGCQGIHITKPNPNPSVNNGPIGTLKDTLYLPISGGVLLEAQYNYNCSILLNPLIVEWYKNGILVASGTPTSVSGNYVYKSFYTTLVAGDYQTFFQGYYNPDNHSRTVTVLPFVATSLKENYEDENIIFPNPSKNMLTIKTKYPLNSQKGISIIDLSGKEMVFETKYENAENEINLNYDLEPGIYFLQILTSKGKSIKKIIVTK